MIESAYDRIMSCSTLPTLPTVAVQLLELTRDPNVTIPQIGKLVQFDQGLAAKVLKTANSSLYGLSKPCTTIDRALGFLGLKTVKSLVLSFSLVDSTKGIGEKLGFDQDAYWRRAIYTAAAARTIAARTGACDPDEAFLGGLFQDMGVLASVAALGRPYIALLEGASGSHRSLSELELSEMGFTHARVGADLAAKWKLPAELVACIRFQDDGSAEPGEHKELVRVARLGSLAAAVLMGDAGGTPLGDLRVGLRAMRGGATTADLEGLLATIAETASQLAATFRKSLGERPDIARMMAEANERLLEMQLETTREADGLRANQQTLERQALTDALTGVGNRKKFDHAVDILHKDCAAAGVPLGVLFIDADRFKNVNDRHGHAAGDAVLVELARRISARVGDAGVVCRYGGEEFTVLLPRLDESACAELAERIRRDVEARPIATGHVPGAMESISISVSIGVACRCATGASSASAFVRAADEALYVAKHEGRNRVRTAQGFAEAEPASAGVRVRVLVVDEDPLASLLIQTALQRRPGVEAEWVGTIPEAVERLRESSRVGRERFDAIVCDLCVQDVSSVEFIRRVRSEAAGRALRIMVVAATTDPKRYEPCMLAGADAWCPKARVAADMNEWVGRVVNLVASERVAA